MAASATCQVITEYPLTSGMRAILWIQAKDGMSAFRGTAMVNFQRLIERFRLTFGVQQLQIQRRLFGLRRVEADQDSPREHATNA